MSASDPASEPEPAWRAKLDIALDAMKVGRTDISEPLFDELDEMEPGWQFQVPMRGRAFARYTADWSPRYMLVDSKPTRERMVKQLIATMLWEASQVSKANIARAFGVDKQTVANWITRGERILFGNCGSLEEDFDDEATRRTRRFANARRQGVLI